MGAGRKAGANRDEASSKKEGSSRERSWSRSKNDPVTVQGTFDKKAGHLGNGRGHVVYWGVNTRGGGGVVWAVGAGVKNLKRYAG